MSDVRITKTQFVDKLLIKEMKYIAKPCKQAEILTQAF
jgi:hypothetical protein